MRFAVPHTQGDPMQFRASDMAGGPAEEVKAMFMLHHGYLW